MLYKITQSVNLKKQKQKHYKLGNTQLMYKGFKHKQTKYNVHTWHKAHIFTGEWQDSCSILYLHRSHV